MYKAVVLFSGGQDSCTVLEQAVSGHGAHQVLALTVDYGQRHIIELECAKFYTQDVGCDHKIIDASFYGSLVPSALTSDGDVTAPHELVKDVPASFVPNRNAMMLTLAHSVAQKHYAHTIYGGMCETDFSGYPDCREGFVRDFVDALNIGSNCKIIIETPLMHLTKAQTWQLADDLGVVERVRAMSHTCYLGVRDVLHEYGYGCGTCPACVLREKGWKEYTEL